MHNGNQDIQEVELILLAQGFSICARHILTDENLRHPGGIKHLVGIVHVYFPYTAGDSCAKSRIHTESNYTQLGNQHIQEVQALLSDIDYQALA